MSWSFPEKAGGQGALELTFQLEARPAYTCARESRDYLTLANILLLGQVDFVALRLCQRSQLIRNIRQN